ncbi:ABC transporter ATP-binding protein [Treponema pedis]|uniref:ABC transporter ATP-binding protein n=1 Tax=Treponema pedis TaxID=409322 RepID=UPI00041383D6|nr:ABC transporter ATP-binding protein [Treponema pedis]
MQKKTAFRKFAAYYKPYKFLFFFDLLCAFAVSAVDLVFPQVIRYLTRIIPQMGYAQGFKQEIINLGLIISSILLGLYILKYFAQYFITSWGHIMGARMERDMRNDLFNHLQKLSFSYYDNHNTGDMISRIVSDLFDISELAHHGPENLFISAIKILGSFILLLFINVKLTLILMFVTFAMIIFTYFENKRMQKVFMLNRKTVAGINSQVQDSLSGIRVVQSFANEELESKKFYKANEAFVHSKYLNYTQMGRYFAGNGFLQGLFFVITVAAGVFFIAAETLTVADLTIYVLYINIYIAPINVLLNFTEMLQKGSAGFKRFLEIIETVPSVTEDKNAEELKNVKGDIKYENVDFSYNKNSSVLKNISINIPAGKTVALVGPSGSGKTTICSLLPRFYDVTSGKITIDGKDIRSLMLKSLRGNIGIVQQDVYLFGGTIKENIAYGNPEAGDEEIIQAAKNAHIHDFILSLKDGYDSYVGERGVRLSGGQKQRISIARVFLKNPPILILDEATSALDTENEVLIQKAIEELSENRTVIVIAHRLSTIRNADTILVITDEGIAERGSHAELLKLNGIYAGLRKLDEI